MNHLLRSISMDEIKTSENIQLPTKISFVDNYKQQCSLQNSNTLIENRVWLGVEKDINGKTVNARMLLTQEQMRFILPYLQKFADTGDLP